MPADEIPVTLWIVLGSIIVLLVFVLVGQMRLGSRLRRIEYQISDKSSSSEGESHATGDRRSENHEQNKLFNEFLEEEPERMLLAKKEQFAAFRKWRNEKGLNWSA